MESLTENQIEELQELDAEMHQKMYTKWQQISKLGQSLAQSPETINGSPDKERYDQLFNEYLSLTEEWIKVAKDCLANGIVMF